MPQKSRKSLSSAAGTASDKTPRGAAGNGCEKTPGGSAGKGVRTPLAGSGSNERYAGGHNKEEETIRRDALHKVSIKYPAFISRDAFEGSLVDVEAKEKPTGAGTGATLWMSESAMFAHSFSPGIAVAVSVAVSVSNFSSDTFPLESLASLCSKHYNIEPGDAMIDEVGTYFAVAILWPSRKLLKNEVRLSRHLSCTIGNPSLGRNIYVFPLHISSTSQLAKKIAKLPTLVNSEMCQMSVCECTDLQLKWLAPKNPSGSYSKCSHLDHAGSSCFENGQFSSPKTPSGYRSSVFPSDDIIRSRSPLVQSVAVNAAQQIQRSETAVLKTDSTERTHPLGHPNWDAVRVVLEDEKLKELLQRYGVRWLSSRILLQGNFVTIPVCGQMCVFQVKDCKISSEEMSKMQQTSESANFCSFSNLSPEEDRNEADTRSPPLVLTSFLLGCRTKINFLPPANLVLNSQHKDSLSPEARDKNCTDNKPLKLFPNSEALAVSSLGGLSEHVAALKEIINFSLLRPHTLARLGLQPTRGVLLYGPPGTGKTSLASACTYEAGVNMFSINGPELVSEYYGESEQALRTVFKSAELSAPSVVFIDELDAIAPTRKDGGEELSQRMVAALLALIDGVNKNHRILVIAATNRPESIDPALRRPGRLDREFEIGVPSPSQRFEILQAILHRMNHSLTNKDLQSLSSNTHGFVGADLTALCNEAAMSALRRYISMESPNNGYKQQEPLENRHLRMKDITNTDGSQNIIASSDSVEYVSGLLSDLKICSDNTQKQLGDCTVITKAYGDGRDKSSQAISTRLLKFSFLKVTIDDFEVAKMKVRPSALREVMLEIPKVCWSDIGGQAEVKQQLKEAVEWPQKYQHAFLRIGTHPPRGVLMFGPPGCSKTLMARAVASEAGLNFLAVKGPELFSKWVGESEKAIRSLFAKARAAAPSVIFFDEIDGLAVAREHSSGAISVGDRVMSQLLVEMDGLNPRIGVTVIAATNRPDKIDAALLRPGRFDRLVYVGPPNQAERKEIFDIHTRKMPCGSDLTTLELASVTDGYTGADISSVCREAAMAALEENIDIQEVSMRHFKFALDRVQPSDLSAYENLSAKFQRLTSSGVGDGTIT